MSLFLGELKHEVLRKSVVISFHSLVEVEGFHPIEHGQVTVQHNFVFTDEVDPPLGNDRPFVRDDTPMTPLPKPVEFAQLGACSSWSECNFARGTLTPVKVRLVRRAQQVPIPSTICDIIFIVFVDII